MSALPESREELEALIDSRLMRVMQPADTVSENRLVNQPEAQRLLNISANTMHRWINSGMVPKPKKINNRNFWQLDELLQAVEESAGPDRLAPEIRARLDRGRKLRHV
jgi:predicted DNA-binding transcriptional regulator AlpA